VTSKDVVKLLTNAHVTCGTKGDKIDKIKQALAGQDQLRSSILIKGKDANQVNAFDLPCQRLSAPGYLTQPTYNGAAKASEDFKSLAQTSILPGQAPEECQEVPRHAGSSSHYRSFCRCHQGGLRNSCEFEECGIQEHADQTQAHRNPARKSWRGCAVGPCCSKMVA
jgi:hypothetical protein